jgi:hypothetical protein
MIHEEKEASPVNDQYSFVRDETYLKQDESCSFLLLIICFPVVGCPEEE